MHDYNENASAWKKTVDSEAWHQKREVKRRAMHQFLTALVLIHRDATGTWVEQGEEQNFDQEEASAPFILACLNALPHKSYKPGMLRDVLKGKDDNADALNVDGDLNLDWLYPNAKRYRRCA